MAIITVTTLDDSLAVDTEVSLREALQAANTDTSVDGSTTGSGDDTIVFDPGLAIGNNPGVDDGHLVLDNVLGELSITSDVTIDGDTDSDDVADIAIDADGNSRVFNVTGGTSTLDALMLTGGDAPRAAPCGSGPRRHDRQQHRRGQRSHRRRCAVARHRRDGAAEPHRHRRQRGEFRRRGYLLG